MPRRPPSRRRFVPGTPPSVHLEPRTLLAAAPLAGLANPSFDDALGARAVRLAYDVDGSGLAAAVIDTGVDYTHPELGGRLGGKVTGRDLAEGDDDPRADTWSHGTMVAGLIASTDPRASGVAPGAGLVGLRVFGDDNRGSFDRIADALQWVLDHHAERNISVVNVSLSDGSNSALDWRSDDGWIGQRIAGLVDALAERGIPVVAASGNRFAGREGMGFLAILTDTVSVAATGADGRMLGETQRLSDAVGGAAATDLVAPGQGLLTTGENGATTPVDGTSFAAPLVSGAILLLQAIHRARFGSLPAVADLLGWLRDGARPVRDDATGATFRQLDIAGAAARIPNPASPPPTTNAPPAAPTPSIAASPPAPAPPPATSPTPLPPASAASPSPPGASAESRPVVRIPLRQAAQRRRKARLAMRRPHAPKVPLPPPARVRRGPARVAGAPHAG
jgi:type VI secretion system secreted protein VgrG